MAETDPNQIPEQPEDAASDATDTPEEPGAETPAEEPSSRTVAEDLAAEALKAAQAAVSGLNHANDDETVDDAKDDEEEVDAASAAADAAMAAMLEQAGGGQAVSMPSFSPGRLAEIPEGIDLLSDVNLDVTIELGRTRMYVEDVLKLAEGAVVELDKLAGDPVDIYVNRRHVAKGEVLILNENFCVRISEIVETQAEAAAG